jgi:hypothetical protein
LVLFIDFSIMLIVSSLFFSYHVICWVIYTEHIFHFIVTVLLLIMWQVNPLQVNG